MQRVHIDISLCQNECLEVLTHYMHVTERASADDVVEGRLAVETLRMNVYVITNTERTDV